MSKDYTPSIGRHPYFAREIVLTSKHQKLRLIKPPFERLIGCNLTELQLDTDQLGTFSGEIERTAPPRETAVLKARMGMKKAGIPIGIASEGSVGPDPLVAFLASDIEHLVLVDDKNEIVIAETFRSFEIHAASIKVKPGQDFSEFLSKADFPNHGLIVRTGKSAIKAIQDFDELNRAIESVSMLSPDGLVTVESDLRAMYSPSRQKNIEEVAKLLAKRVSQLCPKCRLPGWGGTGFEKGLKCSECHTENPNALRQEVLGCVECDYQELGKVISTELNPAQCLICNP